MPVKELGAGTATEIDRFGGGVGWLAHPDETMRRASHALATDEGVFLVDPVDAEGVDALVADLGEVAGVVVLLEYHARDAERITTRATPSASPPATTCPSTCRPR
nr:hypothetical protein [Halorarius litoreus]